ncbi:MAG TPA: SDR family NAD(P)-dependent oxidoreductase [Polyangiaceae bacterium]|nr:SDR family NAD(P)-dependent oxidoreductase [Polyangiaceae bacterium]
MATLGKDRPLAAVTGASSGIGYELAREFARNGYDLVVGADDAGIHVAAQAFEAEGANVYPVQVDLRRYEDVERFFEQINERARPLEAIAINAGVGVFGDFARETDLREEIGMIHLNVVSTVHLAKLAAVDMVRRGRGKILITASVAGTMPTPLEAVYGATKAFDLSFAASLRHELKDTGVSVTAVLPGPTDTEFFDRAGAADTKAAEIAEKNDPADVAKQSYDALMACKDRVYAATSIGTKLQGMASRFIPESTKANLHEKMAQPGSRGR